MLGVQVDGAVQQRTGRAQHHPVRTERSHDPGDASEGVVGVHAPDVATVHDAEGKRHGRGQSRGEVVDGGGPANRIDVEGVNRQSQSDLRVVADEGLEGGREHQRRPPGRGAEPFVDAGEALERFRGEVQREDGLVQLNPRRVCANLRQEGLVDGYHGVEVLPSVEARLGFFAEVQEGHRAGQDGLRRMAECDGFANVLDEARGGHPEGLPRRELGDDVVVVRVEPLRHLHRHGVVVPPRHAEVGVQRHVIAVPVEPLGDGADHGHGVEHAVVEREVADRYQVDAGLRLQVPVGLAEFASDIEEPVLRNRPLPVALQGFLQFAIQADSGEAERVSQHWRGMG